MAVTESFWARQPQRLFHGTTSQALLRILRDGLVPDCASRWDESHYLQPRPGHVYLSESLLLAQTRGTGDQHHCEYTIVLTVDRAALDPRNVNPDDDAAGRRYRQGKQDGETLGMFCERIGFGDDPAETEAEIADTGKLAYRGVIPASAISVQLAPAGKLEEAFRFYNPDALCPDCAGQLHWTMGAYLCSRCGGRCEDAEHPGVDPWTAYPVAVAEILPAR